MTYIPRAGTLALPEASTYGPFSSTREWLVAAANGKLSPTFSNPPDFDYEQAHEWQEAASTLHVLPENKSEVFKNYFPRLMIQVAASFSFGPHLLPQAIEDCILDSILKGQLYTDQLFNKDVAVGHITQTLNLLNTNLIFRSVSRLTCKDLRKIEHFGRETLLPGPILEAWMAMREKAIQVNKFDKFYATFGILSCSNYHAHTVAPRGPTMWRMRDSLLLFCRMSKAGLEISPRDLSALFPSSKQGMGFRYPCHSVTNSSSYSTFEVI
ncbi:uncharacterized protein EV420DRAFT_1650676 [Desarmillaria tabescens]|uniref:Uncharacterized protein n=1 Tax=Armillaria tabescens TaxID=1929756 RepID=A0AA39JET0_ARMTA|nr:uncharacterized protein EV420DRAFT_1650676 [Desarmillaria tabescens]KAK0440004.1 hypothetical protein EV420DRAFT_1650676 [Desarmillaria tabescens]